jgi:hypothetical protein
MRLQTVEIYFSFSHFKHFNVMSIIEKRKATALNTFKGTYPNATSADLQAFVLGMQAMEKILQEFEDELENDFDYGPGDLA